MGNMIEAILFTGGMLMAWAIAGVFCAERQRRLKEIQDALARQRAAEAARRNARRHLSLRPVPADLPEAKAV